MRGLIAAIDNAEAVPVERTAPLIPLRFGDGAEVARRELSQAEVRALLAQEAVARTAAAGEMARRGRVDRAQTLHAEAALVSRYLVG